jgi:hypothetical protein
MFLYVESTEDSEKLVKFLNYEFLGKYLSFLASFSGKNIEKNRDFKKLTSYL